MNFRNVGKLGLTTNTAQLSTSSESGHQAASAFASAGWRTAFVLLAGAALLAAGCTQEQSPQGAVTPGEVQQEAAEATDAAARLAQQEKNEFLRAAEQEMSRLKSDLEVLKQQAQAARGKTRVTLDAQIALLEEKWNAAQAKVEALRAQSAEAWQDMKQEVVAALTDLRESYQEVRRSLSQG